MMTMPRDPEVLRFGLHFVERPWAGEDGVTIPPDFSPCDSPIEDIFHLELQKHIAGTASISRQAECQTRLGRFYLDFLVTVNRRRVAFECDGRDFHNAAKDSMRDRAILRAGHADRIFRLRGRDIYFHIYDALDLIRSRERHLFCERGHHNLERLATHPNEHRDEYLESDAGFPFGMIRWYERASEDGDADDDEQSPAHSFPTVVCWTDRTAAACG